MLVCAPHLLVPTESTSGLFLCVCPEGLLEAVLARESEHFQGMPRLAADGHQEGNSFPWPPFLRARVGPARFRGVVGLTNERSWAGGYVAAVPVRRHTQNSLLLPQDSHSPGQAPRGVQLPKAVSDPLIDLHVLQLHAATLSKETTPPYRGRRPGFSYLLVAADTEMVGLTYRIRKVNDLRARVHAGCNRYLTYRIR